MYAKQCRKCPMYDTFAKLQSKACFVNVLYRLTAEPGFVWTSKNKSGMNAFPYTNQCKGSADIQAGGGGSLSTLTP